MAKRRKKKTKKAEVPESKPKKSETKDDENIDVVNINWKKYTKSFKHHNKIFTALTILVLLLVPLIVNYEVRNNPPDIHNAQGWAQNSVLNQVRIQASTEINRDYSKLPQDQRNQLIDKRANEILNSNPGFYQQQINQVRDELKKRFQYEYNGKQYMYLGDLDSYFWLRYARNIDETGKPCDEIKDGECWDNHMVAPKGKKIKNNLFHSWGIVVLNKVQNIFGDVPLMQSAFLLPMVGAALAIIAAFLLGMRLAGIPGGFFSALMIAVHQGFIGRTLGSDTDVWNAVFPFIIFYVAIEFLNVKNFKWKVILASLIGLLIGVYSIAWEAWWFTFDLLVIALIVKIVLYWNSRNSKDKTWKDKIKNNQFYRTIFTTLVIIVSTFIFISLIQSPSTFFNGLASPIKSTAIQDASHADLWPNVYTTVAELNRGNLDRILISQGKIYWLWFSIIGIFSMMLWNLKLKRKLIWIGSIVIYYAILILTKNLAKKDPIAFLIWFLLPFAAYLLYLLMWKYKDDKIINRAMFGTLLFLFMAGSIFAATKGIRFTLLMVPAYCMGIGLFYGNIVDIVSKYGGKLVLNKKIWAAALVIIIFAFIFIQPIKSANNSTKGFTPGATDVWWGALEKIKETSQPDAIINSWWDFGHWFKYIADRPVTADGASQNTPMAQWLGRMLKASSPTESLVILRLLACGSNDAFDVINEKYDQSAKSYRLLNTIIEDPDNYETILAENGYTQDQISRFKEAFACVPPENYIITSADMIGKSGVWNHFGSWDFDKAYAWSLKGDSQILQKLIENGVDDIKAGELAERVAQINDENSANGWIGPFHSIISSTWAPCAYDPEQNNEIIVCTFRREVNNDANQRSYIEAFLYNESDINQSAFLVTSYSKANNQQLAQNFVRPRLVAIGKEDSVEVTPFAGVGVNFEVFLDVAPEKPRLYLTGEGLVMSLFAQLYFLDSRYSGNFEKVYDGLTVGNSRIVVWKVKWPDSWMVE